MGQPDIFLVVVALLGATYFSYLRSCACSMVNSCGTTAEKICYWQHEFIIDNFEMESFFNTLFIINWHLGKVSNKFFFCSWLDVCFFFVSVHFTVPLLNLQTYPKAIHRVLNSLQFCQQKVFAWPVWIVTFLSQPHHPSTNQLCTLENRLSYE